MFDHYIVDKPYAKKALSFREMEHEASKAASKKPCSDFSRDGHIYSHMDTEPLRFGRVSRIGKVVEDLDAKMNNKVLNQIVEERVLQG